MCKFNLVASLFGGNSKWVSVNLKLIRELAKTERGQSAHVIDNSVTHFSLVLFEEDAS